MRIRSLSLFLLATTFGIAQSPATIRYSTFLGGTSHASAVVSDRDGNFYVTGYTFTFGLGLPVTMGAYRQTPFGIDGFVAKFDPEGALVYCTYLGGSDEDQALGIAVDSAGSVYVVGRTFSLDFPTTPNAISTSMAPSTTFRPSSGFVTKLSPAGDAIVYSTLLGTGGSGDTGLAIAVDGDGQAVITGSSSSTELKVGNFLAKLNADGTAYVYVAPSVDPADRGAAIALDGNGNAYVTGKTTGTSTRAGNSVQSTNAKQMLFRTHDVGAHWIAADAGLAGLDIFDVALDPRNDSTVYAATSGGLFRSTDSGTNWNRISAGVRVYKVVIDPGDSQHLVIFTPSGLEASRDGGTTWLSKGRVPFNSLVFDPKQPQNAYAGTAGAGPYHSRDGGDTWTPNEQLRTRRFTQPALDAADPTIIYGSSPLAVYKSVDAGVTWAEVTRMGFEQLIADPARSGVLYGLLNGQLQVSIDGGATWNGRGYGFIDVFINPYDPSVLFLQTQEGGWVERSVDGASIGSQPLPPNPAILGMAFSPRGTWWTVSRSDFDAFLTQVRPDGSTGFSTYFGGSGSDSGTALALDTEGNIYVTGITNSGDLNGSQDAFAGTTDVFLAKFSNDGSRLLGAKTWGGPGYDAAAALSFDGSGNVLVVGATAMPDNLAHATYFRLDAAWSQLDTVTFGGSFIDLPTGVAVALSGRICIVGDAGSEDFPVTADALTPRLTGGLNAFMMLLDFAR